MVSSQLWRRSRTPATQSSPFKQGRQRSLKTTIAGGPGRTLVRQTPGKTLLTVLTATPPS